jgi:hypothetical protein
VFTFFSGKKIIVWVLMIQIFGLKHLLVAVEKSLEWFNPETTDFRERLLDNLSFEV